jgi:redox-sensitive bicupin YhaK (pirin superfamily)
MTAPRYQGILRDDIPSSPLYSWSKGAPEDVSACDTSEGSVRVVAGRFKDAVGPAKTWTQVDVWDVNIAKESTKEYVFDMVEDNNVIIFVRKGKVEVQGHKLGPQDVAIANLGGSKVLIALNRMSLFSSTYQHMRATCVKLGFGAFRIVASQSRCISLHFWLG